MTPPDGAEPPRIDLPHPFELGVATSAYQIEGAWDEGGKGPSIWDVFSQTPGKVVHDIPGDRGVDHYHRMPSDVALLASLGVDSYRFSLSWSRLLPEGTGQVNRVGVDFYLRLFDALADAGISANVTLYHWDLPQALEDRGGWLNRDVQHWFGEYAAVAYDLFGDRAARWATLNEPIANWAGYGMGVFAPGKTGALSGRTAMHHALLAHGQAVSAFRASGAQGEIGIVVDVWKRSAVDPTPENLQRVRDQDADAHEAFLNPLFKGGYSDHQVERWREDGSMPQVRDGDEALAAAPIDFFGLNIYNRVLVDAEPGDEARTGFVGGNFLDSGKFYDPEVAYEVLGLLHQEYRVPVPIYVTENGIANCSETLDAGRVHDRDRIEYVRGFLHAIARAAADGVDVRGYYLWSFLDNYEWSLGYSERYGIVHVDFGSFERTPKDSAYWFRDVIAERSLWVDAPGVAGRPGRST
ncbi:GH1 family beta-glucosidase [Actinotalea sp. M2MS4P-6]|uniref:GH1 family beta-glucosidase n=1 Tax=Actinotalea sp. M2MS4P-6 TaxID=2983762 RepID=UPI0021E423EF|nr:GH1 family beta-glucosidase [Actinotalea sp. M2MS4P-6]MCV2394749.1 GH1 family beta-glucosidase [Actinotalea sp. M2MS4P-6]